MLLFAGLFELSFGVNLRNWNSILYENGRIVHSNGEVFNLLEGFFRIVGTIFLEGEFISLISFLPIPRRRMLRIAVHPK